MSIRADSIDVSPCSFFRYACAASRFANAPSCTRRPSVGLVLGLNTGAGVGFAAGVIAGAGGVGFTATVAGVGVAGFKGTATAAGAVFGVAKTVAAYAPMRRST